MRYFNAYIPGRVDSRGRLKPRVTKDPRRLQHLPKGTEVHALYCDQEGTICDIEVIPVVGGRAQIRSRNK